MQTPLKVIVLAAGLFFSAIALTSCGAADTNGASATAEPPPKGLVFATFFGGAGEDSIRDITTDKDGSVYITGGTASKDFPTTTGSYRGDFTSGGTGTGTSGEMDVFVAKFSPKGQIVWSTYLGGPNYDRAYAIELDAAGNVIVAGRAGEGFPVTADVVQPQFGGHLEALGAYGRQDGFVAKISPDGKRLIWATYFGGADASFIRDLAVDAKDDLYIALAAVRRENPHITGGVVQEKPGGGNDAVIAKLSGDGRQVLWATYLGGSADDGEAPSIKVSRAGEPHVLLMTNSPDIPISSMAFDRTINGDWDLYAARLSADGRRLIYGTYLGGSKEESLETHSLALDAAGRAFITGYTASPDYPVTPDAFQRKYGGAQYDVPVTKLSADGSKILASTFVGGRGADGAEGIQLDDRGFVYVSGATSSPDFPVATSANRYGGKQDMFAFRLDNDLNRLDRSATFGGKADDIGRALHLSGQTLFVGGMSRSADFPTGSPFQAISRGDWEGVFIGLDLERLE